MEVLLRIRPTFRFEQVGISGGRLRTLLPCLEIFGTGVVVGEAGSDIEVQLLPCS
uniref:Uncharacterized protein n=1 Tax=Hyaloperonospora arabidopsidis (strain Emoy2) TaxID=559515 RepID=M4C241_HYAAE